MMKKQLAGLVLALSVVGGVGAGVLADVLTTDEPAAAYPGDDQSAGRTGVVAPGELTVAYEDLVTVKVGMSKADALATGYFVADREDDVDGCPVRRLAWKDQYVDALDVQTLGNGEISSIGIFGTAIVRTDRGAGIGSTYDEIRARYPDDELVDAGYGQSGVRMFDSDTGRWIGFLFDSSPEAIDGSSRVIFMELTKGAEPSLMRDGC